MKEIINKILATIFEKFKLKSPIAATIVLLLLGTINYALKSIIDSGIDVFPVWIPKVLEIVSFIVVGLTGSSTYNYLNPPKIGKNKDGKIS